MPKKGVRVVITGAQRRTIEVDAMAQIVIALGREMALRRDDEERQHKVAANLGAET